MQVTHNSSLYTVKYQWFPHVTDGMIPPYEYADNHLCEICNTPIANHGYLGGRVCPGDFILTQPNGNVSVVKPAVFYSDYTITTTQASIYSSTWVERVHTWLVEAFIGTPQIINDPRSRNHRFLEEALELVQSCSMSVEEARELVEYVFNRPIGEPFQEVGGVSVSLAALCHANNINLIQAAEAELIKNYSTIEQIRDRQATKPNLTPVIDYSDDPLMR